MGPAYLKCLKGQGQGKEVLQQWKVKLWFGSNGTYLD